MIKKMVGEDTIVEGGGVNDTLAPGDDTNDIKLVMVEGQEQFECAVCGKLYKHKRSAESHINKIHKKAKDKVVPDQIELQEADDDEEFDMNRLTRWENMTPEGGGELGDATLDGLFSSQEASQEVASEVDHDDDAEKEETMDTLKQELVEVKIKMTSMEEEYAVMEANAKDDKATRESLEQALATNKQLLDVSEAKANSLEMELEGTKTKIKRFEGVFKIMEAKEKLLIDAAKKNVDPLTEKENKDLKEELKTKKKETEEANRKANEAMKKLKQETNARSVAQAEIAMKNKFIDTQANMISKLERSDEIRTGEKRRRSRSANRSGEKRRRKSRSQEIRRRREKSLENNRRSDERGGRRSCSQDKRKSSEPGVCWSFSKSGGCSFGKRCKYSHPSPGSRSKSKDRARRSPSQERSKRRGASQERRRERESSPGKRSGNYSPGEKSRRNRSRSREKEQTKEECRYWLLDTCSFGSRCHGLHDPSRRGIRRREALRSSKENKNIQEPRCSKELMRNQEDRRNSTSKDQDFLNSLASRVSQGIAKGCEALLPKLAPAPPAPLPQLAPVPQLQLAPAPQPSFSSNPVWRGSQPVVDGSLFVMRQGPGNGMWDGVAGGGPDRLSGWRQ